MEAIGHTLAMCWTYRSQSFEFYVSMNGPSGATKDFSRFIDVDENCSVIIKKNSHKHLQKVVIITIC